jgi:hypothetical protein
LAERHASPRSRQVMRALKKRPTRDSGACDWYARHGH